MTQRVIIIGAGNLATNVANAMHQAGVEILQVYSHTAESANALSTLIGGVPYTTSIAEVRLDADIYIYALKDSILKSIVEQVDAPKALHIHTAGSMGIDVFDEQKPHAGVFYPFQTLSKQRLVDFSTLPIFIEARNEEDLMSLKALANRISSEVYVADSAKRERLHVAGVFANNFTNCMYRIAEEILADTGIPSKVLLNLIDETAAKVHSVSPREAQTGPSKRWDENVIAKHIKQLPTEELKTLYRLISANIHAHA